jgi:hypothetical protein
LPKQHGPLCFWLQGRDLNIVSSGNRSLRAGLPGAPATNIICMRSSSPGALSSPQRPRGTNAAPALCICAALSIAARLPCRSILSSPPCGVRTIASMRPRIASLAPVRLSLGSRPRERFQADVSRSSQSRLALRPRFGGRQEPNLCQRWGRFHSWSRAWRAVMTRTSSSASTGFAMCQSNPAASAISRSAALACAVTAIAATGGFIALS